MSYYNDGITEASIEASELTDNTPEATGGLKASLKRTKIQGVKR